MLEGARVGRVSGRDWWVGGFLAGRERVGRGMEGEGFVGLGKGALAPPLTPKRSIRRPRATLELIRRCEGASQRWAVWASEGDLAYNAWGRHAGRSPRESPRGSLREAWRAQRQRGARQEWCQLLKQRPSGPPAEPADISSKCVAAHDRRRLWRSPLRTSVRGRIYAFVSYDDRKGDSWGLPRRKLPRRKPLGWKGSKCYQLSHGASAGG